MIESFAGVDANIALSFSEVGTQRYAKEYAEIITEEEKRMFENLTHQPKIFPYTRSFVTDTVFRAKLFILEESLRPIPSSLVMVSMISQYATSSSERIFARSKISFSTRISLSR